LIFIHATVELRRRRRLTTNQKELDSQNPTTVVPIKYSSSLIISINYQLLRNSSRSFICLLKCATSPTTQDLGGVGEKKKGERKVPFPAVKTHTQTDADLFLICNPLVSPLTNTRTTQTELQGRHSSSPCVCVVLESFIFRGLI
jgi:hypothetical protein